MADRERRNDLLAILCATLLALAQPCTALVISEVMFHPVEAGGTPDGEETLEFVELYNNRAVTEDVGEFAFTNGIDYTFPAGTMIDPKTYIVVAKNPAAVEAAYGITGVYGPFTAGALNNDGERLTLSNANGGIVITFRYGDGHPWYPAADGAGHSLTLVRWAGDPEEPSSWAPSALIGGTPGAAERLPAGRLLINELLTNSESGGGLDWIEVYNPGPVAINLSNVYLSDGRFDLLGMYKFANGLVLQPGDFTSVGQTAARVRIEFHRRRDRLSYGKYGHGSAAAAAHAGCRAARHGRSRCHGRQVSRRRRQDCRPEFAHARRRQRAAHAAGRYHQ